MEREYPIHALALILVPMFYHPMGCNWLLAMKLIYGSGSLFFFLIKTIRTRREWMTLISVVSSHCEFLYPPPAGRQDWWWKTQSKELKFLLWFLLTPGKLLILLGCIFLIYKMEWNRKDPVTPQILEALLISISDTETLWVPPRGSPSTTMPLLPALRPSPSLPSHQVAHPDFTLWLSHEPLRLKQESHSVALGKFMDPGA